MVSNTCHTKSVNLKPNQVTTYMRLTRVLALSRKDIHVMSALGKLVALVNNSLQHLWWLFFSSVQSAVLPAKTRKNWPCFGVQPFNRSTSKKIGRVLAFNRSTVQPRKKLDVFWRSTVQPRKKLAMFWRSTVQPQKKTDRVLPLNRSTVQPAKTKVAVFCRSTIQPRKKLAVFWCSTV